MSGPPKAFRWDATTGMESISVVFDGGAVNSANAVSDDGKTVVGVDGQSAFKWTRGSGLNTLAGVIGVPDAFGVSADGSIVVGTVRGEAFRWTQAAGIQGLDDLPGGAFSSAALDITPDGSTIVGYGSTGSGLEAFIWTQASGMRSLMDILAQSGINLAGWHLQAARGISDNGQVIVGSGVNPQGRSEAWVIIIPAPSTFGLVIAAAGIYYPRRRKTVPTIASNERGRVGPTSDMSGFGCKRAGRYTAVGPARWWAGH